MNAKYGTVTALTLALLAATTACSKPPEEYKELRSRFHLMVERMGSEPPCSHEIPMHWSPSLPVPVLIDQRLHYRVFFSGWEGRPDTGIVIHDAEGDALFSTDSKILECRQRSQAGRTIPGEKFPAATQAAFDARQRTLYGAIEDMAQLYARATPLADAERTRVQAFSLEFLALTASGHAASYRALNPKFWAWIEQNGGTGPKVSIATKK